MSDKLTVLQAELFCDYKGIYYTLIVDINQALPRRISHNVESIEDLSHLFQIFNITSFGSIELQKCDYMYYNDKITLIGDRLKNIWIGV